MQKLGAAGSRRRVVRDLENAFMAASILSSAFGATAVEAQSANRTEPVSPSKPTVCVVPASDEFMPAIGTAKPILASCHGQGVVLGYADSFSVAENPGFNAVLVDLRRNGARRVVMVVLPAEGPPSVEDLSGDISASAGKGPRSPIDDVDIDLARFARDGSIDVRKGVGMSETSRIRLDDRAAGARADAAALGQQ